MFLDHVDRLPNLQLLEGAVNVSKQATMPLAWVEAQHPDPGQRGLYQAGHDLDSLPEALAAFPEFFERRKTLMVAKLSSLLGVEPGIAETEAFVSPPTVQ
jgi:hypothetical protein